MTETSSGNDSAPAALPPLRRNRDFRLLWIGQAVSVLGTNISSVAYPLLVLATGGSAAQAGLVGFLGTLPYVLMTLPAGALVDRWDRKRVMLTADTARALVLVTIAGAVIAGHPAVWLLAVAAFVEGCFSVFFGVSEAGAVRHVVPEPQITAAMAQTEARVRGATLLGQPLGGILFGLGHAVPFVTDAATYLVSLVTLGAIRGRFNDERSEPQRHILHEIREGIVWLWAQPFLRACVLLVAVSNFAFQALVLAIIVLAKDHGAGSSQIGVMLAGFGAGGLLGAVTAPWLQPRLSPRAVVVGANWVWAALTPLILLVPHPYAIGALAAGMAFVGPLWNVVIGAFLIRLTPDALMSRVISVAQLLAAGAVPLGSLLAGLALDRIGTEATITILSALLLATAIAATVNRNVRMAPALE